MNSDIPSETSEARKDPDIATEQSRLHWGANETINLLQTYAAVNKPFFIRWDPPEPHLPNIVPEPYASMYSPEEIPVWGSFGDTFENKPYIQRQQLRSWMVEEWTWKDWSRIISLYFGEITLMDHEIGHKYSPNLHSNRILQSNIR